MAVRNEGNNLLASTVRPMIGSQLALPQARESSASFKLKKAGSRVKQWERRTSGGGKIRGACLFTPQNSTSYHHGQMESDMTITTSYENAASSPGRSCVNVETQPSTCFGSFPTWKQEALALPEPHDELAKGPAEKRLALQARICKAGISRHLGPGHAQFFSPSAGKEACVADVPWYRPQRTCA